MRRRRGFTFVEILTAMTVIAILAGVVLPKIGDVVEQAKAAAVQADIGSVRTVLGTYLTTHSNYPPTAAMGVVPDSLVADLGAGFFNKADYQLQYNNWQLFTLINGHPSTRSIIGITVRTSDARVGQLVLAKLAASPHFQSGNNYTFIIDGL